MNGPILIFFKFSLQMFNKTQHKPYKGFQFILQSPTSMFIVLG